MLSSKASVLRNSVWSNGTRSGSGALLTLIWQSNSKYPSSTTNVWTSSVPKRYLQSDSTQNVGESNKSTELDEKVEPTHQNVFEQPILSSVNTPTSVESQKPVFSDIFKSLHENVKPAFDPSSMLYDNGVGGGAPSVEELKFRINKKLEDKNGNFFLLGASNIDDPSSLIYRWKSMSGMRGPVPKPSIQATVLDYASPSDYNIILALIHYQIFRSRSLVVYHEHNKSSKNGRSVTSSEESGEAAQVKEKAETSETAKTTETAEKPSNTEATETVENSVESKSTVEPQESVSESQNSKPTVESEGVKSNESTESSVELDNNTTETIKSSEESTVTSSEGTETALETSDSNEILKTREEIISFLEKRPISKDFYYKYNLQKDVVINIDRFPIINRFNLTDGYKKVRVAMTILENEKLYIEQFKRLYQLTGNHKLRAHILISTPKILKITDELVISACPVEAKLLGKYRNTRIKLGKQYNRCANAGLAKVIRAGETEAEDSNDKTISVTEEQSEATTENSSEEAKEGQESLTTVHPSKKYDYKERIVESLDSAYFLPPLNRIGVHVSDLHRFSQ